MTGSTVSAYGDIQRTNPRLHFPTYVLALTYGRPRLGAEPSPLGRGLLSGPQRVTLYVLSRSGGAIRTRSYASVDKHRCQLGYYDRSALAGIYVYLQKRRTWFESRLHCLDNT